MLVTTNMFKKCEKTTNAKNGVVCVATGNVKDFYKFMVISLYIYKRCAPGLDPQINK